MPNNRREKIPAGTLCVVCDDLASGIHYGVASCNGCKTFYRRALVNKQTFQCQFNGDCVVGKSVRCVCRACRLKKCFDTGMDPKAIQHDRDKIRYTKELKKAKEMERQRLEAERQQKSGGTDDSKAVTSTSASSSSGSGSASSSVAPPIISDGVSGTTRPPLTEVKVEDGSPLSSNSTDYVHANTPSSSGAAAYKADDSPMAELQLSDVRRLVDELVALEDKVHRVRTANRLRPHQSATTAMYNQCLLDDDAWMETYASRRDATDDRSEEEARPCSPDRLRDWFVKDLTLMIEWGKSLPVMHTILLNDKLALMKAFASVFPLVQLAFYSHNYQKLVSHLSSPGGSRATIEPSMELLSYPDGSYIDHRDDKGGPAYGLMFGLLADGVMTHMARLRLDRQHIVLFKMLLLCNPDAEGLSVRGKATIEEERERLLKALYVYLAAEQRAGGTHSAGLTFANLLILTSTLSRVASFIRRIFDINAIFQHTNDLIDQLIIVGL